MDTDSENMEGLVGSPLNETDALMEADEDGYILEERTKSMDSTDGGGGDKESETSKLLNNTEPHPGRQEQSCSAEPKSPREFSYAYHFKKKYTFRSDSVYSDVTPMSSAPMQSASSSKNPESRDKSGSLSSLKGSQSKWVSLKKKLGKINTLSSGKSKPSPSTSQEDASQQASSTTSTSTAPTSSNSGGKPVKSLADRRSFLQRAKTLSILPINNAPKKEKEVAPKKPVQPPELFNVGGEMNLIPLEMLIDINDIKRPQ